MLLVAAVCVVLAIALYLALPKAPSPINNSHTTIYPTPGSVSLPPTAPVLTPTTP
jgi:hypothetical protein